MIIGIDIRALSQGQRTGVGEYTYELVKALLEENKTDTFVLFCNAWQSEFSDIRLWSQYQHVYIVATRWPNKIFHTLLYLKLFSLDRFVWKRVSHFFTEDDYFDWWYAPNIHFTHISSDVRFMLTIHDVSFAVRSSWFSWKRRLWHWLVSPKTQCERANIIVTPSLHTLSDIAEVYGIDKAKIFCIYPGVSSVFSSYIASPEQHAQIKAYYHLPDTYILTVGTIEPRKNIIALIEAHQLLPSDMREQFPLIIVGSKGWKSRSIMNKITQTSHVRYLGYIPSEHRPVLYDLATCTACVSLYEGFGLPVLESLYVGTPTIASARASLPEVAHQSAYYIDPVNIADIAYSLQLMVKNDTLRNSLGHTGRLRAQLFSWKKSAAEFFSLLS